MMVSRLRSFCEVLLSGAMLDFGDVLTLHPWKCHKDCFSIRIYGRDGRDGSWTFEPFGSDVLQWVMRWIRCEKTSAACGLLWLASETLGRWCGTGGTHPAILRRPLLMLFYVKQRYQKTSTNIKKQQKIKQNQISQIYFEHILNIFRSKISVECRP